MLALRRFLGLSKKGVILFILTLVAGVGIGVPLIVLAITTDNTPLLVAAGFGVPIVIYVPITSIIWYKFYEEM